MHNPDPPKHWSICLPTAGSALERSLRRGSALVVRDDPGSDRLVADFEGNLYGAVNLRSYAERLLTAAWRSRELAPTVARRWVTPDEIVVIGTFELAGDGTSRSWIEPRHELALAHWLGVAQAREAAWCAALPASLAWADGDA